MTRNEIQANFDAFEAQLANRPALTQKIKRGRRKRRENKKLGGYITVTTGDPVFDMMSFNSRLTPDGKLGPMGMGGFGDSGDASGGEGGGEGIGESFLREAKRDIKRYYIRPQNIFCSNKGQVLKALVDIGDQNCSIYSLKRLQNNEDVHQLTNNDIIYYYDQGILYDKNKVKVMDYDLYIKHQEQRKKFSTDISDKMDNDTVKDEYEDRMTAATFQEALNLDFIDVDVHGDPVQTLSQDFFEPTCVVCGELLYDGAFDADSLSDFAVCRNCFNRFVVQGELNESTKIADTLDPQLDKYLPIPADFFKLVIRMHEFGQLGDKAPFICHPQNIAGSLKDGHKTLRYLVAALVLGWNELADHLADTAYRLGYDKADITMVLEQAKARIEPIFDVSERTLANIPDYQTVVAKNLTTAAYQKRHESLAEGVMEMHPTLNPKLWTKDNKLKTNVKKKILQIVETFLNILKEDDIQLKVKDIILIGSNANYNYNKNSDLDVHICADTKSLKCPQELYAKLYSAYRTLFKKRFDIDFYNIPVQVYVQVEDTPKVSAGEYSVASGQWLKEPSATQPPEIDEKALDKLYDKWEKQCKQLLAKKLQEDAIQPTTAYMLRNDGTLLTCGSVHPYLKPTFASSFEESINSPNFVPSINWYIQNTLNTHLRELLVMLQTQPTPQLLEQAWTASNDEFCRVRTSNIRYKYGGDNGEIYFRISSTGFNWFDAIWKTVYQNPSIKYVTVVKDNQSTGSTGFNYYSVKGQELNKRPRQEFITLGGRPILESIIKNKDVEAIEDLVDKIYQLRADGLKEKQGEYSIKNLCFKKLRNAGYLDKLADKKNKIISNQLSLD